MHSCVDIVCLIKCKFVSSDRFVILHVMAHDADEGENGRVSYRIQSGNNAGRFSLSPNTGKLNLTL